LDHPLVPTDMIIMLPELQDLLDNACRRHRVPGAVIGVHQGDSTFIAVHGVANINTGEPMTAQTVSQIASVSKLFTARALHVLLAEHGISVDSPVNALVPELAALDDAITIRRLLDHTSGMQGDLWDDFGANGDAISKFAAALPSIGSITAPGELFSYCNTGYVALGRLVEILGGASFDRVIDRLIIGSLGLTHTTLRLTDAVQHRLAIGHDLGADGVLHARPYISMRCLSPTGGAMSTVPDLLRFAASIPAVMREQSSVNPEPWTAGPGWCLGATDCSGTDGVPVFGHDGLWIGAGAYVRVVPDRDLVIAMVGAAGHARTVWQEVYGELLTGLGLQGTGLPETEPDVDVDASRYVGTYRRLSQYMTVEEHHGVLQMTTVPTGVIAAMSSPTTVPLLPRRRDVFMARASTGVDLPVVFLGDSHQATYLHTGMRVAKREST
jgi:CubicO group peptidase (beta-lactamase class C family)